MPEDTKPTIGFIGQGWIGKNYADDFERRGFEVVRYALEEPYVKNGETIRAADIVFIAVPTPTINHRFDDSILRAAVKNVGAGKIAVIKSTLLPGTTEAIQAENPELIIMHSPEFLREAHAADDAAHPKRNIIGVVEMNDGLRAKAAEVLAVLPRAPYELVCTAREAELVKYGGNALLAVKVLFMNLLYDVSEKLGCDWQVLADAMAHDERLGNSHWQPVHRSNEFLTPGRGFGGHCFPKDFAALRELYAKTVGDGYGLDVFDSITMKNLEYLTGSGKDLEIVKEVYGQEVLDSWTKGGHDHKCHCCG